MTNIFTLEKLDDFSEKINIDDLYEKKRQYDLNQLALFNKILNRIHVKIKTTSRQKMDEQFCWYIVPEIIIGVPKFDQGACIAYLLDKLQGNGFAARYVHPNMLFVCWKEWVPSYVRTELKKKTGIAIDEFGNKIQEQETESEKQDNISFMFNKPAKESTAKQPKKAYTPIGSYKPSGNLVYNEELLNKLEDKFN